MTIVTVRTTDEFRSLQDEWNACVRRSAAPNVFLTWEWLFSWWEVFGQGMDLWVLTARDATGQLVGVAPLMRGGWMNRTLGFIGEHSVSSEYLDFVCESGYERPVVNAFLQHLQSTPGWHLLRFFRQREDTEAAKVLAELVADGRACRGPIRTEPALFATLPATFDDYLATLSSNARYNIRRQRRRLDADFTVAITTLDRPSAELFDDIERLHQARIADKGSSGSFSSARFREFYRRSAERLADAGAFRAYLLSLNGQHVAVQFGYQYEGVYYQFNSGLDPSYGKHSVGLVLLSYCIERCIEAGLREFDFLGPGEHKLHWGVDSRQKSSFVLGRGRMAVRVHTTIRSGGRLARGGIKQLLPQNAHGRLRAMRTRLLVRFGRPIT